MPRKVDTVAAVILHSKVIPVPVIQAPVLPGSNRALAPRAALATQEVSSTLIGLLR